MKAFDIFIAQTYKDSLIEWNFIFYDILIAPTVNEIAEIIKHWEEMASR